MVGLLVRWHTVLLSLLKSAGGLLWRLKVSPDFHPAEQGFKI